MAKLDNNAPLKEVRNAWFKHIFFPLCNNGELTNNIGISPAAMGDMHAAAMQIYDVLTKGKLSDCDGALVMLGAPGVIDRDGNRIIDTLPSERVAECIADFCRKYNLTIDDYDDLGFHYGIKEKEAFRKSILGQALDKANVLVSSKMRNDAANAAQQQAQQAQTTQQPAQQASGGSNLGPRPHKANIFGLQNNGQKLQIMPPGAALLWISGEFIASKSTKPRVFTKPAGPCKNGLPQMFVNGTGQGYEDCVLFFDASQYDEVRQICEELNSSTSTFRGSKVKSYSMKKVRSSGEYYEIEVEKPWGGTIKAYIKAERIQEMLDKKLKEDADLIKELPRDLEF